MCLNQNSVTVFGSEGSNYNKAPEGLKFYHQKVVACIILLHIPLFKMQMNIGPNLHGLPNSSIRGNLAKYLLQVLGSACLGTKSQPTLIISKLLINKT